MKKQYFLMALLLFFSFSMSAQLVINEAHFDPASGLDGDANGDGVRDGIGSEDEFIEFVNNSSTPLDISGYKIYDKTQFDKLPGEDAPRHTVPASTIIPAGGVYIVFGGGDVSAINNLVNVTAHTASSGGLSMTNTSEVMTVTNAAGTTLLTMDIDALSLDSNDNQSLVRVPAITGNFRIHQRLNGKRYSPGVIDASIKNLFVLNEIFAKPGTTTGDANGDGTGSSTNDEFIELVNNSGSSVNISGYKVYDFARFESGTPNHIVPGGTTLADGGVFVLFGGGTPNVANFGGAIVQTCSNTTNKLGINNSTVETIVITDASDNVVCIYDSDDFGLSKDVFEALTRNPEITGNFELHRTNGTGRFSPGFRKDGATSLNTFVSGELDNTLNSDGDWNTDGNWSKGAKPTASQNAIIPLGRTVTINNNNFEVANLEVKGTLTIDDEHSLTVKGNIVDTGTLTINSGGSLIVNGTSSGNVTYNRELNFVSGNLKGWHLTGAPVTGQTYNNAYATTNSLATSATKRGLATYNTASDTWTYLESDDSNQGSFTKGVGYTMKRASSTGNVAFTGTLNTDNSGVDVVLATTGRRFNVLANPYTSYLSSATFLNGNAAISDTKTIWVWNQTLSTNGAYEVKTVGDDFKVAPGQGFFVKANTGGGTFNFAESNQSHNGGTDTFQKSEPKQEVKITISDGTIYNYAKIYYLESATTGFDVGYEGEMFSGTPNPFAVYSHLVSDNKGKKYQVQSLPNSNHQDMIVPLGVNAEKGKQLSFTVEAKNLPDGIKVFIEDKVANTFVRLDEANSEYKINLDDNIDGVGRFYMHTKSSVLNTNDILSSSVTMFMIDNNQLKISGLNQTKNRITVYNILGQNVFGKEFSATATTVLQLPKLKTGVYLVKLTTDEGLELTKKVLIK